jgi:RimJ/RimL family protein N-acetyltransferase
MIQVLETPRLRLRHFVSEDADFVLELINEPAWIAGIRDAGVRTLDAARDWLQSRLIDPCWQHGHGFWCVERRQDGKPNEPSERLGLAGIFKRDSLDLPDLGYGFLTRHTGQGYAREAAAGCLVYAEQVLGRRELLAITAPHNLASKRLLLDLGFTAEGAPVVNEDGSTQHWRWRSARPAPADVRRELRERFFACFAVGAVDGRVALPALLMPEAEITHAGQRLNVRELADLRIDPSRTALAYALDAEGRCRIASVAS